MAPKSEVDVDLKEDDPDDPDSFARSLKPVLMEAIQDVFDELETVYDSISKSAKDHIHSECVPHDDKTPVVSLIPAPCRYLPVRSSLQSASQLR